MIGRERSAALVAALWLWACGGGDADPVAVDGFDGERAWADLVAQVRIGPRPAGSAALERTRVLLEQRLRQAGWRVERHRVDAKPPGGPAVRLENLRARLPGRQERRIALGTHYDTKHLADVPDFQGANDGASGTAVLLELARQLSREPRELGYELMFFDGEESFGPHITAADGLFGSRALAAQMASDGELDHLAAFLLIDMVGDRDLNLSWDPQSSPELVGWLRDAAREQGVEAVLDGPRPFIDDHTPFLRRGVQPLLALIDFQYGARETPGPYWHTAGDTLDAVSAESLNIVGELLVQVLARLETRLAASTTEPPASEGADAP